MLGSVVGLLFVETPIKPQESNKEYLRIIPYMEAQSSHYVGS